MRAKWTAKEEGGSVQIFVFIIEISQPTHIKKAINKLYLTIPSRINDLIEHNGLWNRF